MKFLEAILGCAFLLFLFFGLWFCFAHYIRFLSKLTYKRIKKDLNQERLAMQN
ncbi:hypothetical protein [Gilliamella sp. Bif1-4]|jgi:hypothetical protein|uniref:hypothetical protein n=1 Tax=Gilliamella sp. Bif1-4 TaxID=3120233 RepID=UPI00159EBE7C|nr:hypothetical protein [Gilliamella apicola]